MDKINQFLFNLGWKDILKDIIANTVTGIVLLYLGSIEPFNSLLRNITKSFSESKVEIYGAVFDEYGEPVKDMEVFIPQLESSIDTTDEKGEYSILLSYSKENKMFRLKGVSLDTKRRFTKELNSSDFLDKERYKFKDIRLDNAQ